MFTSRDVAKLAGVSQSTVSYVLTGKRPISQGTRARVEAAIEQLTYHPNAGARALASQRTRVIGLVAPFGLASDRTGLLPFIETIASGVREHDHDLLLVTADEGAAGLVRVAGRRIVDALVVMEVEAHDERIPVAAALDVPVVLIGLPDDAAGLPCVDVDFELAGRLAVAELAACGYDRSVLLGHPRAVVERDINYVRRFQAGAAAAATELGLPHRVVAPVEPDAAAVGAAVDDALAGGGRPGLVVPSTSTTATVLRVLAARGAALGEEVGVVGLSTDADARDSQPPVTNASLEPRDVSRRAVEALFAALAARDAEPAPHPDGAHAPPLELVPPRLTRRATTRPSS